MARAQCGRVPVTLITGWHAGGKSALAARILQHVPAATVVTTWRGSGGPPGAIEVPESIVHLHGSCPCCALRWDLVSAATVLASRIPRPARLVIELGGDSDPALAVQTLLREPAAARRTRLDNVLAVVDASTAAVRIRTGQPPWPAPALWEQVAIADHVVLSHVDRISGEALAQVRAAVSEHNPLASVSLGGLDGAGRSTPWTGDGFGPGSASRVEALEILPESGRPDAATAFVEVPGVLGSDAVREWLSALHRRFGRDLLRLRGVVAISGDTRRRLLSGARTSVHQWSGAPWTGTDPFTRLALVGRGLPARALRAELVAANGG